MTRRTADEIGRTTLGPRPIPTLDPPRPAADLSTVDTVLPNGLRVVVVQLASVPMVELRIHIPLAEDRALTELLAAGLLCGTAKRDRAQIHASLGALGGEVVADVNPERLRISASGLAAKAPELFDVVADALSGATYPDALMEQERARLLQQQNLHLAQPAIHAQAELRRHCYGDHPYARLIPSTSDLQSAGIDQVRRLHARAVVPRGSVAVLVGDLSPELGVRLLTDAFARWNPAGQAVSLPPLPPVTGGLSSVPKTGSAQAQIRLCAEALPRDDPRFPALRLATQILGGSFSSRLMHNLRERLGYTYVVRSVWEFTPGSATVTIETDTASDVTAAALGQIQAELAGLVQNPPAQAEIDAARQYLIGSELLSASSQAGLAGALTTIVAAGLTPDWLRTQPTLLAAVTPSQVVEVAAEFLAPDRFSGVIIG